VGRGAGRGVCEKSGEEEETGSSSHKNDSAVNSSPNHDVYPRPTSSMNLGKSGIELSAVTSVDENQMARKAPAE
jgi:hypothetical protein